MSEYFKNIFTVIMDLMILIILILVIKVQNQKAKTLHRKQKLLEELFKDSKLSKPYVEALQDDDDI